MKRTGILVTVDSNSPGFQALKIFLRRHIRSEEALYFYGVDQGVLDLQEFLDQKRGHFYNCSFSVRHYNAEGNSEKIIPSGLSLLVDIMAHSNSMIGVLDHWPYLIFSKNYLPKKVLIKIASPLIENSRAWEGIRIALGIQAWEQIPVEIILCRDAFASKSLTESEETLLKSLIESKVQSFTEIGKNFNDSLFSAVKILNTEQIKEKEEKSWFVLTF